jgi:hypothetical protein
VSIPDWLTISLLDALLLVVEMDDISILIEPIINSSQLTTIPKVSYLKGRGGDENRGKKENQKKFFRFFFKNIPDYVKR